MEGHRLTGGTPTSILHNARVRAGAQDPGRARADEWQTTYLDTITILLTLFLLIVSVGQLDDDSREAHEQALRDVATTPQNRIEPAIADSLPQVALPTTQQLEQVTDGTFSGLQAFIDRESLGDRVSLRRASDEVVLDIRDSVLFPSGSAAISAEGVELLGALSTAFLQVTGDVSVEGHSDNLPITTERFPSNWELSAGRASAIVRIFEEQGLESERLHAVAYGATRPVASNATEPGRARNRRVEIKIKTKKP